MASGSRTVSFILITLLLTVLAMLYHADSIVYKVVFRPTKLDMQHTYRFSKPWRQNSLSPQPNIDLNVIHFYIDKPKGAILYFHGNKDNLDRWGEIASELTAYGWDVFVPDYRGYGKSTGEPSESGLYEDAGTLYRFVNEKYSYDRIIFYGRSLGTGVASWLASQYNPSGIVLETPYYSLESLITRYYPLYTYYTENRIEMNSAGFLQNVKAPVMILHGTEDPLIPIQEAARLYDSIPFGNKTFIAIAGGTHDNLPTKQGYQIALDSFFRCIVTTHIPLSNMSVQ